MYVEIVPIEIDSEKALQSNFHSFRSLVQQFIIKDPLRNLKIEYSRSVLLSRYCYQSYEISYLKKKLEYIRSMSGLRKRKAKLSNVSSDRGSERKPLYIKSRLGAGK
jgi:UDP-2,3-diacylglucosamine pyrophosphatase LpxH